MGATNQTKKGGGCV